MSEEYKTTWRREIAREMERNGESFADCEGASPKGQEWLDAEFDPFDSVAPPFYLWTGSRVYFVVCYDMAQSVASVPRGVSDEEPTYFGGRGGLLYPLWQR